MKYAKFENNVVVQVQPKLSIQELESGLFSEVSESVVCGQLRNPETGGIFNPEPSQPTQVEINSARAIAYSDLLTGSDRFFNEARRKAAKAEAYTEVEDTEGAKLLLKEAEEATKQGLIRAEEIKKEYPID